MPERYRSGLLIGGRRGPFEMREDHTRVRAFKGFACELAMHVVDHTVSSCDLDKLHVRAKEVTQEIS